MVGGGSNGSMILKAGIARNRRHFKHACYFDPAAVKGKEPTLLSLMTIFDKISGFAQKAKENALSRAVLAKDKRLDKSMSESIEAAHIGLLKV